MEGNQAARIRLKERINTESWRHQGACAEGVRSLTTRAEIAAWTSQFYPTRHSGPDDVNRAKAICAVCPVRAQCLAYALVNWEKVGIWGGETENERRVSRRSLNVTHPHADFETATGWAEARLVPQAA